MPRVFIAYRREDSEDIAGRIYDRLRAHYGEENVVYDVVDVPLGIDFRTYLDHQVRECDVLLAVIGRDWLTAKDQHGKRRLDSPSDFLRIEIESAIAHGIPVVPVLVRRARVPPATELPASLAFLQYINGATVSSGKDFDTHIERLIQGIARLPEILAKGGKPSLGGRPTSEPDPGEKLLEELKHEALKLLPSATWKRRHDWWLLGSDRGFHILKAKPTRNTLRVRVRKNPSRRTGIRANTEGWVLVEDSKSVVFREKQGLKRALTLFKQEWL
jgi:hypothetical protein